MSGPSCYCSRCGTIVGTSHPKPECDARYDMTYVAARAQESLAETLRGRLPASEPADTRGLTADQYTRLASACFDTDTDFTDVADIVVRLLAEQAVARPVRLLTVEGEAFENLRDRICAYLRNEGDEGHPGEFISVNEAQAIVREEFDDAIEAAQRKARR